MAWKIRFLDTENQPNKWWPVNNEQHSDCVLCVCSGTVADVKETEEQKGQT